MYRIACYYRVSKYTGVEDESQSINNQRILIHRYIDKDYEINEYIRIFNINNNNKEDYKSVGYTKEELAKRYRHR